MGIMDQKAPKTTRKKTAVNAPKTAGLRGLAVLAQMADRMRLAASSGVSWFGSDGKTERNLYQALGLPRVISNGQYWDRYRRGGVAKRVVRAYPDACWMDTPAILDPDTGEPAFGGGFDDLNDRLRLESALHRLDNLSGINRFAVLLLGLPGDMSTPAPRVNGPEGIQYVAAYSETYAEVKTWDNDIASKRYGLPVMYQINMSRDLEIARSQQMVHHSRLIHVADGIEEDEIYGTPRMEPVWNYLEFLDRVSGAASEAFWRNAYQGIAFNLDPEAGEISTATLDAMQDQIDEFTHDMRRTLQLQGTTVQQLAVSVADPSPTIDAILKLISGTTGIPQRILTGSEMGELASSQDAANWSARVQERRVSHVTPNIVRATIDRFVSLGILPDEDYDVTWADPFAPSESQQIDIESKRMDILEKWARVGGEMYIPLDVFLVEHMGYSADRAEEIQSDLIGTIRRAEGPE